MFFSEQEGEEGEGREGRREEGWLKKTDGAEVREKNSGSLERRRRGRGRG